MEMTNQLHKALTVVSRYTELESALRNLKSALKEVSHKSFDEDLIKDIQRFEDTVNSKISEYSYRGAVEYIENNI